MTPGGAPQHSVSYFRGKAKGQIYIIGTTDFWTDKIEIQRYEFLLPTHVTTEPSQGSQTRTKDNGENFNTFSYLYLGVVVTRVAVQYLFQNAILLCV